MRRKPTKQPRIEWSNFISNLCLPVLFHHTVVCWDILSLLCTVTDFSAAEKDSGMSSRVLVRLLSGQVFSHFGELWLTWSHGGGITSGMSYMAIAVRQWVLGAAPSRKAVYGGICVLQACWRTCVHLKYILRSAHHNHVNSVWKINSN